MRIQLAVVFLVGCGANASGGADAGDGCPDYVQIVDGRFARTATNLTWTLEVAAIPTELTFDRAGLPTNVLEYRWAIELDSDRDGAPDWEVAAKHYKMFETERVTTDLLGSTQEDLWQITGASAVAWGDVDVTLAGNTFTFVVDQAEDPDLANVTDASQSSWNTFHKRGPGLADQCSDRFEN